MSYFYKMMSGQYIAHDTKNKINMIIQPYVNLITIFPLNVNKSSVIEIEVYL